MINNYLKDNEVFGFIRPGIDAHTLGISVITGMLIDCGYQVHIAGAEIAIAVDEINKLNNSSVLIDWIKRKKISRLGFSYRLDPKAAQNTFGKVFYILNQNKLFEHHGGSIKQIYFAGLPEACDRISHEYQKKIPVFFGDETPLETLMKIGVPHHKIPKSITNGSEYDNQRMSFATELIQEGRYENQLPPDKGGYPEYGSFIDSLVARLEHNRKFNRPPLMRVHVGPYNPNYIEAKKEFNSWLKKLAYTGFLDIVSIGSSQLSQSDFGTEWGNKPNGGGVPVNSEMDLIEIWKSSRPMLVRTYAGTKNIPQLAHIYEKTINIAWHALSFWWFNKIDGRGNYGVKENLEQHIQTMKYIASSGKPFEPNIPHHFSFRGGDDYTYVLSAYLAAITAKRLGIRYLVLQTMLNTPKHTWGVQDLAKARALRIIIRELEDKNFTVFLQPRAGLDYFSPNLEKAKIQLAAVTAMMDDIEPDNSISPDIIHVVSYSEALQLATPDIINESIQITLTALKEYRYQKSKGKLDDMKNNFDVHERTQDIINQVKSIHKLIEKYIPNPYSAEGLYNIFHKGILPVPYLWEEREEFKNAVKWKTSIIDGSVKLIDERGNALNPIKRILGLLY
jgi:hypothetical protein